jgi:tetratricopeptide (TPR) repeat protein
MKFFAALVIFLLAAGLSARAQQSADDRYIGIYGAIQQADSLAGSGQSRQALDQYIEVQGELQKFQKIYPDWNPKIVNFRLKYLAEKIQEFPAQTSPPVSQNESPAPATNAAPENSAPGSDAQVAALLQQIRNLEADNDMLGAKLKEALSVQPAAVSADELVKAQAQIESLLKENTLLKTSLAQTPATVVVADTNALAKAQEQIQSLLAENASLKAAQTNPQTVTVVDTNALAQAQADLAEAKQKLAGETERADKLAADDAALQTRVQSLLTSPDALAALHDENALLKSQLAELKSAATNLPEMDRLNSDLKAAQLQIATLKSDTEVKELEQAALENRIEQLRQATNAAASVVAPGQEENEARIRELTQERNDLLAKLGEANKALYASKKQDMVARIAELNDEIRILRARIAVDEAQAVPYTPEELALFKQTEPQIANPDAEKKSVAELPAGSAELVAEAQNYFSARQFDKAEEDYHKILERDENNSLVLANLAAIELEEGKLDDAEKHIKAALAQNPDDAYNLSTYGYLKFRQEKYDDAFDALSRAAKLDPQNPEIENYLGVTLSHKGLRAQAETALRRAIQIDPNYAAAHNNLAVIYVSQQPPLVELARWHYEKAVAAGQPRNLDLEKMLADKGAPVDSQ